MLSRAIWLVVAAISIDLTTGTAPAQDDERFERMQSRIDNLEGEVKWLRKALGEDRLEDVQKDQEIEALTRDMLEGAHAHTQVEGITAGWEGQDFFIGSRDGNFLLQIGGRIQLRAVYDHQDGSPDIDESGMVDPGAGDDDRWGFEVRRFKLDLWGHVVDPSWTYYVQIASDDINRDLKIDDAYVEKTFGSGWRLRMGQFKPPFMQEDLVSSRFMAAAERSLVNEEFSQRDRSIGIQLAHYGDQFRFRLMLGNGFGNINLPALNYDTEIGLTGRVDFRALGKWSQFKDFASWEGDETGLMLGAALHYERQEYGTSAPGGVDNEQETLSFTADFSLEFCGASLFASGVYRRLDNGSTYDQYGIVVQASYFVVPDTWEGFVRWEYGDLDMGVEDLNTITFGFNRYFARHRLKLTTDFGYGFNGIASGFAAAQSTGWREDAPDENGQLLLRIQFQLLF